VPAQAKNVGKNSEDFLVELKQTAVIRPGKSRFIGVSPQQRFFLAFFSDFQRRAQWFQATQRRLEQTRGQYAFRHASSVRYGVESQEGPRCTIKVAMLCTKALISSGPPATVLTSITPHRLAELYVL
jgi:hypothetical protein